MEVGNLLIVHGGGPTAVLNASLYGVITEAQKSPQVDRIFAARNGTGGLLKEELLEVTQLTETELGYLLQTPGSAIGSSRDPLTPAIYQAMVAILEKHGIRFVLFNGGNGTMAACGELKKTIEQLGKEIYVIGIPKTIDNDISVIDHAPGYGSAARYIAETTREIMADVRSLPIHVCIIEAMGRNAGWIAAASALAETPEQAGPDLIYLPERVFDEKQFLDDVKRVYDQKGYAIVVVSEGLKNQAGKPIVPAIYQTDRATYYGEVGNYLALLVIQKLHIKARNEKPGLAGRASMALQSSVDRAEAIAVGSQAVQAVSQGQSGKMVGIFRKPGTYAVTYQLVDIEEVMLHEAQMPENYLNQAGNGVTAAFKEWLRPLIAVTDRSPYFCLNLPDDNRKER